jgi:hypothetical protein
LTATKKAATGKVAKAAPVPSNEEAGFEVTAEDRQLMVDMRSATLASLKAQPLEKVFIPKSVTGGTDLVVVVNTVRLSYPVAQESDMPASVAQLVRQRVQAVLDAEARVQ